MVAPISTLRQGQARGRTKPKGLEVNSSLTTNAKVTPGPGCPGPVYTCSFHSRGHRERLAWLCILLPTLGNREGLLHHHPGPWQPLSIQPKVAGCPSLPEQKGARGRGGAVSQQPLLSVLALEWVCLGKCCSSSRIGWGSRPSVPLLCHLQVL